MHGHAAVADVLPNVAEMVDEATATVINNPLFKLAQRIPAFPKNP
jgi:hypothetical protein